MRSQEASILAHALRGRLQPLQPGDVLIRTRLGRVEAARTQATIPRRLRLPLALIDGRRSVGDLRAALRGYRGLDDALDMLGRMGFVEPLPQRLDLY